MDDDELLTLLRDPESDRVERKASAGERDRLREAVCAFANDLPNHRKAGVLFLGVNDDGSCADLDVTDRLLLDITGFRDEGLILPVPSLSIRRIELDGCVMAVVVVEPQEYPPVRFRGRTHIRMGPRRGVATPEEERRLVEKRRAADRPFDMQPVRGASVQDLDVTQFEREYLRAAVSPDVLEQNQRTTTEQLRALRFVDIESRPTVLGILTLGKEPRAYIPGAGVQFLRIAGVELSDPIIDQKEISGPISDLIRQLDEVVTAHVTVATDVTSNATETRQPSYPVAALQQLTRNAILHRTYDGSNAPVRVYWFDDRIEIHSPGGPFGQVTVNNFGQAGITDYRNPHLAEVLRVLGYVQRFGAGIQIARSELAKNGNPPLEFDVQPEFILATVRGRP